MHFIKFNESNYIINHMILQNIVIQSTRNLYSKWRIDR